MQVGAIGIGQAGGKILDSVLAYDSELPESPVHSAFAVNTAETDLLGLAHVPEDRRLLIGEGTQNGGGVGADNETGARVTAENIETVHAAIEQVPSDELDAFLLIAALGGGTGSGGMPVLAKHIDSVYDSMPVYAVGVLPSKREGQLYAYNAARSLQTLLQGRDPDEAGRDRMEQPTSGTETGNPNPSAGGESDSDTRNRMVIGPDEQLGGDRDQTAPLVENVILVDNDAYNGPNESLEQAWEQINQTIAQAIVDLFAAGEPVQRRRVPETVVDTADIRQTLANGTLSTVGYATAHLEMDTTQTLLGRLRSRGSADGHDYDFDQQEAELRIMNLVRDATQSSLGFETTLESVEAGLVLVAGPAEALNRRGIERSRDWLQTQIDAPAVRGGDYPRDQPEIQTTVLLSGVHDSERLQELYLQAAKARQTIEDCEDPRAPDTALTDAPTPPGYDHHIDGLF